MNDRLAVFPTLHDLSEEVATKLLDIADEATKQRGIMRIALAGGSTPKQLYQTLAHAMGRRPEWSKWVIYFGDERIVPLDDERSNFAMAHAALLDHVPIGESQIYVPQTHLSTPEEIVSRYEQTIRESFETPGEAPRFDVILLGLGSDGHTASLFPGKSALLEAHHLVVASTPGVLPPEVDRITFTLPFINAARNVFFLVSGADKTQAFSAAFNKRPLGDLKMTPAGLVHPTKGNLEWFITSDVTT